MSKLDNINGKIKQGGLVQTDKTSELYRQLKEDKKSSVKRPLSKK